MNGSAMRHIITLLKLVLVMLTLFLTQNCFALLPVIEYETPFPHSYVFTPNDGKPHPGIIILHGSEGGSLGHMIPQAQALAASGFSVMTYCWFDCDRSVVATLTTPPPILENVELKNTVAAMQWFKKSAYVGNQKLGLYGFSRGAEQALILASYQEKIPVNIDAVAVHAPADIVYGGYNFNWVDDRCWLCKADDKNCKEDIKNWNPSCGKIFGDHADENDINAWKWDGVYLPQDQRIEIEKYTNTVLITCGDKDSVWSPDQTRRIETTLIEAGRHPEVYMFSDEDHIFTVPAEQKRRQIIDEFFHRKLD